MHFYCTSSHTESVLINAQNESTAYHLLWMERKWKGRWTPFWSISFHSVVKRVDWIWFLCSYERETRSLWRIWGSDSSPSHLWREKEWGTDKKSLFIRQEWYALSFSYHCICPFPVIIFRMCIRNISKCTWDWDLMYAVLFLCGLTSIDAITWSTSIIACWWRLIVWISFLLVLWAPTAYESH